MTANLIAAEPDGLHAVELAAEQYRAVGERLDEMSKLALNWTSTKQLGGSASQPLRSSTVKEQRDTTVQLKEGPVADDSPPAGSTSIPATGTAADLKTCSRRTRWTSPVATRCTNTLPKLMP